VSSAAINEPMPVRATTQPVPPLLARSDSVFVFMPALPRALRCVQSPYLGVEIRRTRAIHRSSTERRRSKAVVLDPAALLRALEVYEGDRLDFAEAYLVAQAERSGVGVVASFDRWCR